MKRRKTVLTTNTLHISWRQLTYLAKADTVLRYRILWRTTFDSRQHAVWHKIIYKLVNWVAFSSILFGAKFIIIGTECKTMKFIEGPLFTCFNREIVLLIGMLFKMCAAYADCGSLFLIYLTHSWYLVQTAASLSNTGTLTYKTSQFVNPTFWEPVYCVRCL